MPKITELFVFIAEDKGSDGEGIVAGKLGDAWIPLMGADMKRIDALRPMAAMTAKLTGKKIRLVHFTQREDMEVIE